MGTNLSTTRRGSLVVRLLLTLLGVAGLTSGTVLVWLRPAHLTGLHLNYRAFYAVRYLKVASSGSPGRLITSVGVVMIALAIVAAVGLVLRRGWLTSFAGLVAVVAFGLFYVTLHRARLSGGAHSHVGIGAWVSLAGGVLALIGGFMGARPRKTRSRQESRNRRSLF